MDYYNKETNNMIYIVHSQNKLIPKENGVLISKSAHISSTASIGPNVYIGAGVVIGNGVRIKNSIILNGSIINVIYLFNSIDIVYFNTLLKDNSYVINCIMGWNTEVGVWSRIEGSE